MERPADGDREDAGGDRRDAVETVRDDAYYAELARSIEAGDYVIVGPVEYGPDHPAEGNPQA